MGQVRAEVVVNAEGIEKRFGRKSALAGVSLQAGPGITGLLGPNGAGKTTLLRILATVAAPDRGRLRVLGGDPADAADRLAIRRRLGYLPQDAGLHLNFTAFAFVDYVAILKEMTDRRSRHAEVRRVLDAVDLTPVAHRKIKGLSGGMRRRVALAQSLLADPALLVLDEPTTGLDPEQRLRLRALLSELAEDRTVLVSTHQTEDVAALCQRVLVMNEGTVLYEGSPRQLAERARGKVWLSPERAPGAYLSWRTGEGPYRNIGAAPDHAEFAEPTLEDAYLLLAGPKVTAEDVA